MLKLITTETFKIDITRWLSKCCESKYSEPFDSFEQETKDSIIEEMEEAALDKVNNIYEGAQLFLQLSEKYRTHRYYEFQLRPEHFQIKTETEFEDRILTSTVSYMLLNKH